MTDVALLSLWIGAVTTVGELKEVLRVACDDGLWQTALHCASEEGNVEMLRVLVEELGFRALHVEDKEGQAATLPPAALA